MEKSYLLKDASNYQLNELLHPGQAVESKYYY